MTGGSGRIAPGPDAEAELDGARLLLNPGSVGQPRDGDPRASYLVLDLAAGRAALEPRRLRHRRRPGARCAPPACRPDSSSGFAMASETAA